MFILCNNRAFSLKWVAANEIYWNKREGFFYAKKRFNSQVFPLEHNNGRRFIVLIKQYGGRDVVRLSLGSLLEKRRSAIGQLFSLSLVTVPEVFAAQFSSGF